MANNVDTIYVTLINEDIEVSRPVQAKRVNNGVYRIIDKREADSEEIWEFEHDALVYCEAVLRDGKTYLIAKRLASNLDK